MEAAKGSPAAVLDRELVPVKVPRWMKQAAAQVGEVTHEDLGEVFERLCGAALVREQKEKTAALAKALRGVDLGGEA
jgi:hypothetical protein